jgi:hypothetical protein
MADSQQETRWQQFARQWYANLSPAEEKDAAIIRTFLVPATMRLLGHWNWWFPGLPLAKNVSRTFSATRQ